MSGLHSYAVVVVSASKYLACMLSDPGDRVDGSTPCAVDKGSVVGALPETEKNDA